MQKSFELFVVMFIEILFFAIFAPAHGDDGDLFSSTEDMKKLFSKEEKLRGNNTYLYAPTI